MEQWTVEQAAMSGKEMIRRACDLVADRRDEVSQNLLRVEERIAEPENVERESLIAQLESLRSLGQDLLHSLAQLE